MKTSYTLILKKEHTIKTLTNCTGAMLVNLGLQGLKTTIHPHLDTATCS